MSALGLQYAGAIRSATQPLTLLEGAAVEIDDIVLDKELTPSNNLLAALCVPEINYKMIIF